MDINTLKTLVTEAGPLDDAIMEIVELQDLETGIVVRFEHVDVLVENLEAPGRVGFSAVLDGPDEARSAIAYRALLAANALWRENGGLRIALGSSDNLIELSAELAHSEVTARRIAGYCRGLAEHAATWSLVFQGRVEAQEEPVTAAGLNADYIRI